MSTSTTRPLSLLALGVTLMIAGFVGTWAQDVAAPWINLGEAKMTQPVTFTANEGTYRVVTSGPSRPSLAQTACTITRADGTTKRALGGTGRVNARESLGVSRVLEFTTVSGATRVVCEDRIIAASQFGRYQVVSADGPVSKAILAAFVLGCLSLAAGAAWLVVLFRRRDDGPAPPMTV